MYPAVYASRPSRRSFPMQAVFMPDASTADRGPALVVGYVGDDQAPPSSCLGLDSNEVSIAGPSFYNANEAYVFGRGVSRATVNRIARTVEWGNGQEAPALRLPSGYSLRAASDLPAVGLPNLAGQTVVDSSSGVDVLIGEEQDNAAGVLVARFWRDVLKDRCRESPERTVIRGGTVLRMVGQDTQRGRRAMAQVERSLVRVSQDEFCAGSCS